MDNLINPIYLDYNFQLGWKEGHFVFQLINTIITIRDAYFQYEGFGHSN